MPLSTTYDLKYKYEIRTLLLHVINPHKVSAMNSVLRKAYKWFLQIQVYADSESQTARRLRFFGHIVHLDSDEDHTRAPNAGIDDPPKDWRRPRGRPRQTWLRTVENDLKQPNLGLWSARHRTVNCGVKSWKQQRSYRGTLHDDDR